MDGCIVFWNTSVPILQNPANEYPQIPIQRPSIVTRSLVPRYCLGLARILFHLDFHKSTSNTVLLKWLLTAPKLVQ